MSDLCPILLCLYQRQEAVRAVGSRVKVHSARKTSFISCWLSANTHTCFQFHWLWQPGQKPSQAKTVSLSSAVCFCVDLWFISFTTTTTCQSIHLSDEEGCWCLFVKTAAWPWALFQTYRFLQVGWWCCAHLRCLDENYQGFAGGII